MRWRRACDSSDTWWMAMRRAAARSGEWAQHFSNASCSKIYVLTTMKVCSDRRSNNDYVGQSERIKSIRYRGWMLKSFSCPETKNITMCHCCERVSITAQVRWVNHTISLSNDCGWRTNGWYRADVAHFNPKSIDIALVFTLHFEHIIPCSWSTKSIDSRIGM